MWIAARSARTPWAARLLAVCVAAYALSPIDLVPDFIPVIGYLDDLILVPLAIALVVRLIPSQLMSEFRQEASLRSARPTSRVAAAMVVLVWIVILVLSGDWMFKKLG